MATADPANVLALDDITMATGYEVRRAVASPEDIEALIGQLSRLGESVQEIDEEEDASHRRGHRAARVGRRRAGRQARAHRDRRRRQARAPPTSTSSRAQGDMRVRFRVDGVVIDSTTVPRHLVAGSSRA